MNVKEQALFKAVQSFEDIGFMEWHARVLNVLTVSPKTLRELARDTGLFHYHLRAVIDDLLALQLLEFTRRGFQLSSEWDMLHQLVSCCEEEGEKKPFDYEAAFSVAYPRVLALEKKYD